MDVSVKDVEEIVNFGNSLQTFLNNYMGQFTQLHIGADMDVAQARARLATIRKYEETAEEKLHNADSNLNSAILTSRNYPDEDRLWQIEMCQREYNSCREAYDYAKEVSEASEGVVRNVERIAETVCEELWRSSRQLEQLRNETLSAIQKSAISIREYIKR